MYTSLGTYNVALMMVFIVPHTLTFVIEAAEVLKKTHT